MSNGWNSAGAFITVQSALQFDPNEDTAGNGRSAAVPMALSEKIRKYLWRSCPIGWKQMFYKGLFMKRKISGWIDLLAASVNYIVICFALSHMEIRFQHDPAFILFSASQIWGT